MSQRALPLLLLGVLGCASSAPTAYSHPASVTEQARSSPWVLLTVRSASIEPAPDEPWDMAPKEDPNILGALGRFAATVDPLFGAGMTALGAITTTSADPERALPDPFFVLTFNESLTSRTIRSIAQPDTLNPAWNYAAYIDPRALRAAGLDIEVYDAEGSAPKELIGALNIPRAALERAATQDLPVDIHHVRGHLLALDVRIEPAPQGRQKPTETVLPLNKGIVHSDAAGASSVPAGTIVTVTVAGTGTVSNGGAFGLGCPGTAIGPEGLGAGACRNYNLKAPPALAEAAHGSAFVAVGIGEDETAVSVGAQASCTQFVAETAGPLLFGVNDSEPRNNTGAFTFTYSLASPATPPAPCATNSQASSSVTTP